MTEDTYESFLDYWNTVDQVMLKLFGIHTGDAGIGADMIAQAQEEGKTAQSFALWCGEKYGLITMAEFKANWGRS